MKILLLPAYFFPEQVSDTPLDDARYQAFADAGIEMSLYTPVPTRNVDDVDKKKYSQLREEMMYDGMVHVRRFSMMDEGKNPVGRAFRYFLCTIIQLWYGLREKNVDVVFIISTPPIQGLLGVFLKKIKHIPFIYNLQDIFPDSLVSAGLANKGGLLWKIGRIVENITYRNADKIIVISEGFKRNIMAKGVPEEKIEVVYNWVDENAIIPIDDNENPLFEEIGVSNNKFRVVYAGNLGNAQNLELVVQAAESLKDREDIEFLLFGKGSLEDDLRTTIATKGLTNVKLLPLQPYERTSFVYSLGNVCLVSCKAGFGGSALPSKTWSILSAGRPVIASFDEGELKDIIEENNMGVFTKADDVDDFVKGILSLYCNPQRCKEMGRNGREFILANLSREVGARKYVDIIKRFEKQ